jgi:hypothetical protein
MRTENNMDYLFDTWIETLQQMSDYYQDASIEAKLDSDFHAFHYYKVIYDAIERIIAEVQNEQSQQLESEDEAEDDD